MSNVAPFVPRSASTVANRDERLKDMLLGDLSDALAALELASGSTLLTDKDRSRLRMATFFITKVQTGVTS